MKQFDHQSQSIVEVFKGRGAISNPDGRFETTQHYWEDDGWFQEETNKPKTTLLVDAAKSIISRNQSPDVPFTQSINPYKGCEHGCVYCFARPTHEYLGFSPGLDFETKLFYKPNAAELLRKELSKKSYRCSVIALGVNTDCYQPIEKKLKIARALLEVMCEFKQPVAIITKSALIERDIDLLADMAREQLAQVYLSITSLDSELSRRLEPRATAPPRRLRTLENLAAAGIPTGVLIAPVIPALNEPELETIVTRVAATGAISANYISLRLPHAVKDLFQQWLRAHYPLKAEHVMNIVRAMHGGNDYEPKFGQRMRGSGEYAELIAARFRLICRKYRLNQRDLQMDCTKFRTPAADAQLDLF